MQVHSSLKLVTDEGVYSQAIVANMAAISWTMQFTMGFQ